VLSEDLETFVRFFSQSLVKTQRFCKLLLLTQFTCGKITTKIALGQQPILNNFNCKRRRKKKVVRILQKEKKKKKGEKWSHNCRRDGRALEFFFD
jgi:hypothetical protein